RIDWDGNGKVDQTVTGPSGTSVDHVFPASKSYTVEVTAVDPVGNVGAAPARTVTTAALAVQPDPLDGTRTALVVGGTAGPDKITLIPADATGTSVQVTINGVVQ